MSRAHDLAEIVKMLDARAADLARMLAPQGEVQGHEWVALNPTRADRHLGSFRIVIQGDRRGFWKEHAAHRVSGDMLDLVGYARGLGKREAIEWAKAWLGLDGRDPEALKATRVAVARAALDEAEGRTAARADQDRARKAKAIWLAGAADWLDTPVERYLEGRGIPARRLSWLDRTGKTHHLGAIRFHPSLVHGETWNHAARSGPRYPAMVAAIVDPAGEIIATHRTFLQVHGDGRVTKLQTHPDGRPCRAAKLTYGRFGGRSALIHLWRGERVDADGVIHRRPPWSKMAAGETVTVTEGIEDALTVALADRARRVVAAVSIDNLAGIAWPEAVAEITIVADNDAPGSPAAEALERAIAAMQGQGKRVLVARPPEGCKDINELVRGRAA